MEDKNKKQFKVITDYPGNTRPVGTILTEEVFETFSFENEDKKFVTNIKNIDKYPGIFEEIIKD